MQMPSRNLASEPGVEMNLHNLQDEVNAPEQITHVSVGGHLRLSALWFSLNFQTAALLPIVLPVQLLLFVAPGNVGNAQQATLLGWLSAAGSLVALFIPPIVGALSDRTTGPLGRRRPYIALGTAIEVLGAVVLARPGSLGGLFGGLLLFQVGSGVIGGAYQGLLPDMVPAGQRGEQSGYIGLMTILGNAGSLGLSAALLGSVTTTALSGDTISSGSAFYYLFTAVILIAGVLLTIFGVHETPLETLRERQPAQEPLGWHGSWRERFVADWLAPWRYGNFTWVFLTRASVMLGLSLFMTFIEYYFANVAQSSNFVAQTAALAVLALAGAAASALALGILSDRLRLALGRVPLVCIATGCMALAASGFLVLPPGTPLWPLGLLFGVGFGAYSSVDWALAVDVLPVARNAGKDMGIWSTASNFPTLLAPLVGAVVLHFSGLAGQTTLGYQLVFLLAALCMIAGAVFIFAVRNV
jgi:MFS family permease